MIKVWTDAAEVGFLDRSGDRGSVFRYEPEIPLERAVSVTMPVRLPSYDSPTGVRPIFEMSLPEGALRERLRVSFAKATGTFDDLDLITIVGRSLVGRVRYTGTDDSLDETVPFQSVDEILEGGRGGELYRYLIAKYAEYSGISGVQPKVMVRDEGSSATLSGNKDWQSTSLKGATHIVKFWEAAEFPQLAANEFFCLRAAWHCALRVPEFMLTNDARALVIERFDLRPDGTYRGFEDFCVLNALPTSDKYRGSYESAVFKRLREFSAAPDRATNLWQLFVLMVLNCALRNGDAHLKNFGILYEGVQGAAQLAPAYDLVTTSVYLPHDGLALTLNGTKSWPDAKALRKLGQMNVALSPAQIGHIFERVADGMSAAAGELRTYMVDHPAFQEIGKRMLAEWEAGIAHSLRAG